jgi:hypothetical protein
MCCPANSLGRTFPTEVGAKDAVVWCAASQPVQTRSDSVSFLSRLNQFPNQGKTNVGPTKQEKKLDNKEQILSKHTPCAHRFFCAFSRYAENLLAILYSRLNFVRIDSLRAFSIH